MQVLLVKEQQQFKNTPVDTLKTLDFCLYEMIYLQNHISIETISIIMKEHVYTYKARLLIV